MYCLLYFLYYYCTTVKREQENYCFFLILYPNVATVCCREMRDFFCFCTYIIAIRSFALKFDFTVRDLLRESVQVGKHITVMIML